MELNDFICYVLQDKRMSLTWYYIDRCSEELTAAMTRIPKSPSMFEFKMYFNYKPICPSDLSVSFEQDGCGY